MKRDEVLDLQPGPEMDAAVAEKMEGLTRLPIPRHSLRRLYTDGELTFPRRDSYALLDARGRWVYFCGHPNDICEVDGEEVPAPPAFSSEDKEGAPWALWAFMREHGTSLTLSVAEWDHAECSWITRGQRYTGRAKDEALALCRAFLLAGATS